MDLSVPLASKEDYELALREYHDLFHISDCCAVPDYGPKLYDLIKAYELQHNIKT